VTGLANGDLLIAVNNHDASLTLARWFNAITHSTRPIKALLDLI